MEQLIECVPNFSEGRDMIVIHKIADEITSVENVKLLNIDPGKDTNRTVITFVGKPQAVCQAAFLAVKKAAELIDMTKHKGAHPRFGATDVLPLVPVAGITMEETVQYARALAKRVGEELGIHVFCYEYAAINDERKNLANCRSGEYEGLKDKLKKPEWKPDFGPLAFNKKSGATAVGARNFLIAYNINLNTTSTRRANAIAFDVREKGRVKRKGNPLTGEIVKDKNGKPVMTPGSLKHVKAIGWYIEEYGVAQISMNLTNITETPIHIVFDEVCKKAGARGIRVTGSELVGLIPLNAMLEAGKYFLRKQQRSVGVPDAELLKIAIKSMGLDELGEFKLGERIIEYAIQEKGKKQLVNTSLSEFAFETASESTAPGGGSVAAYIGALGVSLGTMVANLSAHKRGWDDRWGEFSDKAEKGQGILKKLLAYVDDDTKAFQAILEAHKLPKSNEQEIKIRAKAIEEAQKNAVLVPFRVMETCFSAFDIVKAMVKTGNPNSITDAGVGILALRAAIQGALLNVKINLRDIVDKAFKGDILNKATQIMQSSLQQEAEILGQVSSAIEL